MLKFKGHLTPISHVLMLENQVANLTPNLSFGHNFYLITLIRKCEPIFNIYNFRIFDGIWGTQFEPSLLLSIYKFLTKIQNSWRTIIFKMFFIWNFFGFLSLHCPTLVGVWLSTKMWMWLSIKTLFKHAPILCFNLGCKPKARITKVSILVVALCMSIPLLICSCMMWHQRLRC